MEPGSKIQEIKKALMHGGVVSAPRGAGKTSAIIAILKENPNAVVLVGLNSHRQLYTRQGVDPNQVLLFDHAIHSSLHFGKLQGKRLYGDELKLGEIAELVHQPNFHGAATSLDFPITIIKE